ncbi:MAG: carbohydrate kinase family protein [Erysipelotrichaceae bacterium]
MKQIYCMGEMLIDMVNTDQLGIHRGIQFEKKAGGAPANVAVAIARMGQQASFLGLLGADFLGDDLRVLLEEEGIDTRHTTRGGVTTLAWVGIDAQGERSFAFVRGSDGHYVVPEKMLASLTGSDVLHLGSATALLGQALEQSYLQSLHAAKKVGAFISFDPNYRVDLIEAKELPMHCEKVRTYIAQADLVKLSEEEALMYTATSTLREAVVELKRLGDAIFCITLGKRGTYVVKGEHERVVESISVQQVDSTGAGDAFVGALLSNVVQASTQQRSEFDRWCEWVAFANKVGAYATTQYGAIPAIPTLRALQSFLAEL